MKKNLLIALGLSVTILSSCVKDNFEESTEISTENIDELEISKLLIPKGFNFSTHQNIKVVINDDNIKAKYQVYAYTDTFSDDEQESYINEIGENATRTIYKKDVLNHLLFTGMSTDGKIEHIISLPSYFSNIYVRRKVNNVYTSTVVNIENGEAVYNYNSSVTGKKTSKSGVEDYLYCVNGSAELFQINPLSGAYTAISDMPMGSFTAAIDQENKLVYSIGAYSPYPIMKYSMDTDKWTTIANSPAGGGPRLEFNSKDGLLYFSTRSKLYTFDPANGKILSNWTIKGLDNNAGGDLAFAEDGTLFMCTFSGLYKLILDANGDYASTRISADRLPFYPTSMTFDSNGKLWLANNANDADLIIMDTQTGGWEYTYGLSANNDTSFKRTIHDLATFRIFSEDEDLDTDGDGIVDGDDEFPNDAEKAFEFFTPSKYGWGTIAFEDLWPSSGDYDFNDLAVNYKFTAIENAQNRVVQLDIDLLVKTNGASFTNGFGIEFENVNPSNIESVTGTVLKHNYISLNNNGTESAQTNAVIIMYDDNASMVNKPMKVSIKFVVPISTEQLGAAPFNPFIIINKNRSKEVHLPYANTTDLGQKTFEINGINKDSDGNYVTEEGLPWAINIIHNFKTPKEKIAVNKAYNYFNAWATSGGTTNLDWYKDGAGYRNLDMIVD